MTHVNSVHPSYKPCRDFKEGKCKRTKCRYKHRIIKEGNYVCFQCGEDFSEKSVMMRHIKSKHQSSVCKKFLENYCDCIDGPEEECWFRHVRIAAKSPGSKTLYQSTQDHPTKMFQDFQKVPLNLIPPALASNQESLLKSMEERIMKSVSEMMTSLIEQMKKTV